MSTLTIGNVRCTCEQRFHRTKLIAVTGGPGAGKTAVLQMAARAFCEHVAVLPEAATIVFGGGFPRHDTAAGHRAAQRAIFHIQRETETLVTDEQRVAVALCDRGTVDGFAYWPEDAGDYWTEIGTTLAEQLSRYAAVIHLQTPTASEGYDHSNALRIETAAQAHELDRRIAAAWRDHPRRFVIPSRDDFLDKAARALLRIRDELPACCHAHAVAPLGP